MTSFFSPKTAPYLLFSFLSVAFCILVNHSVTLPPSNDEVITGELVRSASFTHLLSAVMIGLDATPPLYSSYGWLITNHVVVGAVPEIPLRITNAFFVAVTIEILFLSIRYFFDRIAAVVAIAAFIFLERMQLAFLTLDIRTYALFVLTTTGAVYFSLRFIALPSRARLVCLAITYCLLIGSHTFGVLYVVSMAAARSLSPLRATASWYELPASQPYPR